MRLLIPQRNLVFPGERIPRVEPSPLAPGVPAPVLGDHRHGADQIDYVNGGYPAITTVRQALDQLLFAPMVVVVAGGSVVERGQSIASVALTWGISKAISHQSLSGPAAPAVAIGDRAATVPGPFVSDATWTVQAISADGAETRSGSTSLVFRSRRHWGTAAADVLDDADVLALLAGELATSRTQTRTVTCADEYIWFAWPAEFGVPDFWVGGLRNTAWIETIREHVNQYGHARSYRLYRSQYRQHGAGIGVEVR